MHRSLRVTANSIFWGNGVREDFNVFQKPSEFLVNHTCIQKSLLGDPYSGTGNTDQDPNLNATFRLKYPSSALDTADPLTATSADLEGGLRGSQPDMGAYEAFFN